MEKLDFKYSDGGRSTYFKAAGVGDCVVRAFAIASGRDYKEVYNEFKKICKQSPRNGVYSNEVRRYAQMNGYEWIATMKIGSGCKVHLAKNELPMDKSIVCSLSGHETAVINGVIHDTYDPSREGKRCVYGYYIIK